MTKRLDLPQEAAQIYRWYTQSQVDYGLLYIQLYIAYNAWYHMVAHTTNDREALGILKKRYVIWDDYVNGRTMQLLRPYMKRLSELSQQQAFPSTYLYWDGEFKDAHDWKSLIEFWYQMRCLIVHGSEYKTNYAWLAYETLNIYLGEIIQRMDTCFSQDDVKQLEALTSMATDTELRDRRFKNLQNKLFKKYISSSSIWEVDMKRVEEAL